MSPTHCRAPIVLICWTRRLSPSCWPPPAVRTRTLSEIARLADRGLGVSEAGIVLGFGVAVVGGAAKPRHRFGVIPRGAAAFGKHDSKVGLGSCIALVGGAAKPAHGFIVVLRHAAAVV